MIIISVPTSNFLDHNSTSLARIKPLPNVTRIFLFLPTNIIKCYIKLCAYLFKVYRVKKLVSNPKSVL